MLFRSRSNAVLLSDLAKVAYEDWRNDFTRAELPVVYREADLQVSALSVSTQLVAGEQVNLSFTVTNAGGRATRVGSWTDRLYLSSDPSLDIGDVALGIFNHSGVLAPSAKYDVTLAVQLPFELVGSFYLLAAADSGIVGNDLASTVSRRLSAIYGSQTGNVEEFQDESNNVTVKAIEVLPLALPDLQVTASDSDTQGLFRLKRNP